MIVDFCYLYVRAILSHMSSKGIERAKELLLDFDDDPIKTQIGDRVDFLVEEMSNESSKIDKKKLRHQLLIFSLAKPDHHNFLMSFPFHSLSCLERAFLGYSRLGSGTLHEFHSLSDPKVLELYNKGNVSKKLEKAFKQKNVKTKLFEPSFFKTSALMKIDEIIT